MQESADGDMEAVRRESEVLPAAKAVLRVPIRDGAICVLPVPAGVGALEPTAGGGGGARLRAGGHRGRHSTAVPGGGALDGDLAVAGGGRRGEAGGAAEPRGGHQPVDDPTQPVGPGAAASSAVPPSDGGGRCDMARAAGARGEARPFVAAAVAGGGASGIAKVAPREGDDRRWETVARTLYYCSAVNS